MRRQDLMIITIMVIIIKLLSVGLGCKTGLRGGQVRGGVGGQVEGAGGVVHSAERVGSRGGRGGLLGLVVRAG